MAEEGLESSSKPAAKKEGEQVELPVFAVDHSKAGPSGPVIAPGALGVRNVPE